MPLICGLALFGFGEGLLVLSRWGATPWTVLAQGVARHLHLPLGWATFAISATILFSAMAFVSDSTWGLIAGTARVWLSGSPKPLVTLRTVGGCVMTTLGALIVASAAHG